MLHYGGFDHWPEIDSVEEAGRTLSCAPLLLSIFRGSSYYRCRGRTSTVAATIEDGMAMISIFLDKGFLVFPVFDPEWRHHSKKAYKTANLPKFKASAQRPN